MGSSIPVDKVPPNKIKLADDEGVTTVLAHTDAWAYYKASVARSLAAEIGMELRWSVTGYTAQELAQLFDSREMFLWNTEHEGYRIDLVHGDITPAPPAFSWKFIRSNGLTGDSRFATLARVIDWCRANLKHFGGGADAANMEDIWQYRGRPPMVRVLTGTVVGRHPESGIGCWTAGCWGTVGLLRALLRAVNIPVKLVITANHAQPWFMADSMYLSHGDDPYNGLTKATPPIPAEEILIDQTTFNAWFGEGVSEADRSNNIGRRTRELGLQYLPDYLLTTYCNDITNLRGHEDGWVFRSFSMNYTVVQLEAENLWNRMDKKIEEFGGCDHIPR